MATRDKSSEVAIFKSGLMFLADPNMQENILHLKEYGSQSRKTLMYKDDVFDSNFAITIIHETIEDIHTTEETLENIKIVCRGVFLWGVVSARCGERTVTSESLGFFNSHRP
jgi:hypothetical protein